MDKRSKAIYWTVLLSETSHVFCCVLPIIFSLLSLLSGAGLAAALPAHVIQLHDFMHQWEVPMIVVSGLLLACGWGLHEYSRRLDCRDTGCVHEPCGTTKKRTALVLKIATVLFLVNVTVYAAVHRGMGVSPSHPVPAVHDAYDGHAH